METLFIKNSFGRVIEVEKNRGIYLIGKGLASLFIKPEYNYLKLKKGEIMEKLDGLKIDYDPTNTREELVLLLPN